MPQAIQVTIPDKDKLIAQIAGLREIAMKKKWRIEYDGELDQLYYSPEELPSGARLFNISNEISLYLDKKQHVQGVFIEYFKNNFIKHNKEFSDFFGLLRGAGETKRIDMRKRQEVGLYERAFQSVLLESLEHSKFSRYSKHS